MAIALMKNHAIAQANHVEVRCAIYTRKSTDVGLEQDFNSLDAQRLAAEEFVRGRRLDNWTVLPDRYDDGGFTGANTDRPGLRKLLDDVAARKINCIVVYKVDRLSRSILDFLKLMELLQQHKVDLVSVTQQIDTSSPSGRLLVHLLLMFAQFEREMISERTRDKMHAARRRGKWIGGNLPLGYDLAPAGRRLVVNESEAAQVKEIFLSYLELGSLIPVLDRLDELGWRMKSWVTQEGKSRGGTKFKKNTLHKLLTNAVYTGRIRFKGTEYPGEHDRIVDEDTWGKVQAQLTRRGPAKRRDGSNKYGALLKGLVRCASCDAAMTHVHVPKRTTIYRYYICITAHQLGWSKCATRSISAPELEGAVVDQLREVAKHPSILAAVLGCLEERRALGTPAADPEDVRQKLAQFDPLWEQLTVREKVRFLRTLVAEVRCAPGGKIVLTFRDPSDAEIVMGGRA